MNTMLPLTLQPSLKEPHIYTQAEFVSDISSNLKFVHARIGIAPETQNKWYSAEDFSKR